MSKLQAGFELTPAYAPRLMVAAESGAAST